MYQSKPMNIGTGVLLLAVTLGILLLSAFGGQTDPDILYENDDYGFSVSMSRGFWDTVTINEGEEGVLFYFRDVPKDEVDENMGIVGEIQVFSKKNATRTDLIEREESYDLRYLGENENYFFGWCHPTDAQIAPATPEETSVAYRSAVAGFEAMITSFAIIDANNENKEI
ncbi:MAG: hypothetical protein CVU86_01065 [Firmicutes bacterium HGW-Firmicutes-11]|jgi:hypothetical protein|nr:MAG: hypothetical protein CVU86_01065 [Firmicutes bacterium HGW-Firmicutes-11]